MTDGPGTPSPVLAEVWRGPILESFHRGRVAVCAPDGSLEAAWGDVTAPILPRSAVKMLQALPLVESGAADAAGLGPRELALACASHHGTPLHAGLVADWLHALGTDESALRCGAHAPKDKPSRVALAKAGRAPDQTHNQCSGKHAGMVTLARHLGAGPEYVEPAHPVQGAIVEAMEALTGERCAGTGIDGCSAPNFAFSPRGLATAMARLATAERSLEGARRTAAERLRAAMTAHPELVACDGAATTELMRQARAGTAVKSGAEGVYLAMLPDKGLGIALKMDDGAERGSDAAMAALLARYGVLERSTAVYARLADARIGNWRGMDCGRLRAVPDLAG